MKAVKVQYTVSKDYIETNKINIKAVMDALRRKPIEGMMYSSYQLESDPNTFIHINIARDGETLAKLNDIDEFQTFRSGLKASNPVHPPSRTDFSNVGSNFDL